jgi:hypothetical protein
VKGEKVSGVRCQVSGVRKQSFEFGIRNAECGKKKEDRVLNSECGLRPLRAVGFRLYESEAIGACAYAPAGSGEKKKVRR